MANLAKFNTRVQLKFDTWANWNSTAGSALVPLKGEVCVCEVPANTAATGELIAEKAYLLKVGDGVTTFGSLPWLSALAADVHSWAKKSENDFKTWLSETAEFATDSELSAAIAEVNNKINALDLTANATGNGVTFVDTVAQADGKVTITTKAVRNASTSQSGIVQLSSATDGTSETKAATEKAVAAAYSAAGAAQDAAEAAQGAADAAASAASAAQDTADGAAEQATTNATNITKIINGTTKVGKASTADSATNATNATNATKATQDASGNVITSTYATKSEVEAINNKISNAMHFLGITTTSLSDGATTATITIDSKSVALTAADAGAVVLSAAPSSNGIQYEYVWTGSAWAQLGQEGSFAVKGSIVNTDISSSAAIASTKIASSLSGGTNLNTDLTGLNDRLGAVEQTNTEQGSAISGLQTAVNTTLPEAIETAIDTLGASLAGTGSTTKTISKITYNESTNKATVTYSNIAFPTVDSELSDTSTNAVQNKAVATGINEAKSSAASANTAAGSAQSDATSALNKIAAMDLTSPSASGTATAFIATVAQADGKVTATKANLPTASTSVAGIMKLTDSVSSTSTTTAATPKNVKAAYDLASSANSTASANTTALGKTWKTTSLVTASSTNTSGSIAGTAKSGNSNLNIAGTDVAYIIFDCGSSTENV